MLNTAIQPGGNGPLSQVSFRRLLFVFFLWFLLSAAAKAEETFNIDNIIGHIEALENNSDPKCYATASRLEDFIYGTPLSDEARFEKNQLQKDWLRRFWGKASELAKANGDELVSRNHINEALTEVIQYKQDKDGHWTVIVAGEHRLKIHQRDKRQYSSIAYSLRSLLAIEQEKFLSDGDMNLLSLNSVATDTFAEALDLFILSALQITDKIAREANQQEVLKAQLANVWQSLLPVITNEQNMLALEPEASKQNKKAIEPKTLKSIIAQKQRSYARYNDIKNQIFVRNLQVFFAKNRWPKDSDEARQFRQTFTETMIAFTSDLYQGAQKIALANGHEVINEADIFEFVQNTIPHEINEYEDAIFFPKFEQERQVVIEAYDMDAFRDSGIHWRYLQYALEDNKFPIYLEPDPFAAELLVENVAQFGVLVLRITGNIGRQKEHERLQTAHFSEAMNTINTLVAEHHKMAEKPASEQSLLSVSSNSEQKAKGVLFSEISQKSGINVMHRSSDWLSRTLRSYLKRDDNSGTIIIPPAFGGSGVATGDVNNDGLDDILLLSGLGNRLYLGNGDATFTDITKTSSIAWVRPDSGLPGEPRQPIIADLNNDGLQDIVITYVDDSHRVYQNLGDAKFKDVTAQSKLGGKALVGGPATVFDYDNDGLLDIYITYFGNYLKGELPSLKRRNTNGLPNKLFKNIGNFRFLDVTRNSGLDNRGWGQAVTHTDFTHDGLQDLIVGNDFGVNSYYQNLGQGKFVDIADKLGTNKPSYTMGIGLADLNGDRVSDIYISNIVTMNKDEKYVLPSADTTMKFNPDKLANMRVVEANDLFLSDLAVNKSMETRSDGADPAKEKLSYVMSDLVGRGYSSTGWSWDADFFDYDNDGDDDLYVLNGMNDYNVYSRENPYYQDPIEGKDVNVLFPSSSKERNVFFQNDSGLLKLQSENSGLDLLSNGRSAVYLDFDADGDLDIVINNYHGKAQILENNLNQNRDESARNWLKVKLTGNPEQGVNLDAIGAKVIVTSNDGWQRMRENSGTIGYMSVHSRQLHFGLSEHKTADILVMWPDGEETQLKGVAANQLVEIAYPES